MAATAGSVFQALRVQHIAGNPPDTDPQRSAENFTQYVARMASHGLNPDINSDESDSDYAVRLASYYPAPPTEVETSSFALLATTATTATSGAHGTTANVNIAAGLTMSFVNGFYSQSLA